MNKFSIEFENCLENRICKLTEKSKPIQIALFQFNLMTNRFIIYIIMNTMKKPSAFTVFAAALLFFSIGAAYSQEALKSTEEEYFDFLSLLGLTERPALNYRTLSDSVWAIKETDTGNTTAEDSDTEANADSKAETINRPEKTPHPWQNNNLGTKKTLWKSSSENTNWFTNGLNRSVALKIYGPEWFNSYNTAAPYGQNDGALWQGKGYNTSLTAGVRLEAYGFEVTVKPQVAFSQNLGFDFIKPNYSATDSNGNATIYNGKAAKYGYYGVPSIDAPQRFGDSSFWTFDWGDTEVRWSWHTLTTGFGTQTIWLGPAQLNPIIHSNNAASYPKFDIGLRKTPLYMPHFGWHLGDIEFRSWWGKLTESDWFDNDNSNNNNLISGLAFAYSFPGIFNGLTIGLNRTMLSKWNEIDAYSLFKIYGLELRSGGSDNSDQRISFTIDWLFTKIGLDMYLEWGRNDFSSNTDYILRYPFHTQGWTGGIAKAFNINDFWKLKLMLEITVLECSDDYERVIDWYSTFYAHHIITQGYTNRGQWLGAGIGTGGNSQYLGMNLLHKKGNVSFFIQRRNPDLDYTFHIQCKQKKPELDSGNQWAEKSIRAMLEFGLESTYFIKNNTILNAGIVFMDEHNPINEGKKTNGNSNHRYNFNITLGAKYNF